MMGNTMETRLVAEWVAGEGDEIEEDEIIAIVESEKSAAGVVANQAGTLARIDVEEGEEDKGFYHVLSTFNTERII
jgi:pyruvate dehydrogenase E2 component (dihydrolipoamide acetyltransferase)